ncbi:MAG TPA: glycosyltransferase family 1 protein [Anaerolineae bacterium]|nr:glycosyltransferase family 1 protein [Anaerolineae bacterium]
MAVSVYFPGYVPSAELPLWYNAADLLVYPSHFEGFGLPVLEAMACGTPVITSTASSLPEVAGSAARLVASNDAAALTGALSEVMSRPDLRLEMRAQGLRQAARFSWDQTARQTAELYTQVIERYGRL